MSVKHQNKKAVELWAKEIAAAGTGGTPGITAAVGGRPKPTPCLKLFSFLHPKDQVDASVIIDGQSETYRAQKFDELPVEDSQAPQIGENLLFKFYRLSIDLMDYAVQITFQEVLVLTSWRTSPSPEVVTRYPNYYSFTVFVPIF